MKAKGGCFLDGEVFDGAVGFVGRGGSCHCAAGLGGLGP